MTLCLVIRWAYWAGQVLGKAHCSMRSSVWPTQMETCLLMASPAITCHFKNGGRLLVWCLRYVHSLDITNIYIVLTQLQKSSHFDFVTPGLLQKVFIFTGTFRMNLDPYGCHGDKELWRVVEEVNYTHLFPLTMIILFIVHFENTFSSN